MEENNLLEKIVEHILLELFEAQKASNEASAKLVEEYLKKKDVGPVEFFPIPNSCIKSFDFSLKFLLKDLGMVVSDNLKEEIDKLLRDRWKLLLERLYDLGGIAKSSRKKLEKTSPPLDYDILGRRFTAKSEASLSGVLEAAVKSSFYSALAAYAEVNEAMYEEAFQSLRLASQLEKLIFSTGSEKAVPLSKIKASFDLGKLDELSEDIICDINVNVSMRNFDSAYIDEITEGNPNGKKRKLLALRNG